jgi:hypothetical protein
MKIHSHEPNSGYKSISKFNVFLNGKPLIKDKPYPIAYNIARSNRGSVIKFSRLGGAE